MALTDDLFESIDTIISARIANLPYDQTIECEVINADDADKGIYKVKYQNAYFEAVSPVSSTYSVGDRVYIQIPQNDYKQDKIILNKKKTETRTIIKTLPFLSFAHDPNTNLFTESLSKRENFIATTANGRETEQSVPINLLTRDTYLIGYTKLGLKFSVSLDIKHQLASGDYGVKITARGYDQSDITYNQRYAEENINDIFEFTLTTKDMIGSNLYNTLGYCNQEKVFDISNKVITSISVSLWQDGNFKTLDDVAVIGRFIKFTNFLLFPGYDISEFTKNKTIFRLYTGDGLKYSNEYRKKTIYARKYILKNSTDLDEEPVDLSRYENIYWEEYDAGLSTVSLLSGYKGYSNISELHNTYPATVTLSTSRLNKTQSYVGVFQGITSNENIASLPLEFINYAYLASSEVLDILTGFQITPAEENGYNGIYNIYGQDNYTTDQIITEKLHHLILTYNSFTSDSNAQGFLPNDIITWTIPAKYTMIREPRQGYDYQDIGEIVVSINSTTGAIENYKITKTLTEANELFYLPYYIKEYYSPQNTNNIIKCEFTRGQDTFTSLQELLFGTSGSQGSEYTVVPYLLLKNDRVKAINQNLGASAKYYLKAEIYDYNNNLMENQSYTTAEVLYTIGYDISIDTTDKTILIDINEDNQNSPLTEFNGCVKLTTQIGGKTIITYYPIPIAKNSKYKAINGSTIITYDITGKKPFYNKNQFSIDINDSLSHNITWDIGYFPEEGTELITNNNAGELLAWPQIINNELNLPSILHQKLLTRKMILICRDNNEVIWTLPLIIISNKYPIGLLHQEPIPVEIEPGKIIKNSMVGELNQQYVLNQWLDSSGVFMGILKDTTNSNELFGLFGYHEKKQTFLLDENGYVYLNGGEESAVQINNALLTNCSYSDMTLCDKIKLSGNLNINDRNSGTLLSILQNGAVAFTGDVDISGALNLSGILNSTKNIETTGNIIANKFIGLVLNYDTTTGNINERLEKLKAAVRKIDATAVLW